MEDPGTWALVWLAVAAVFGIGEILVAVSFFLMPFAVGALAASLASFLNAPVIVSWVVFIVVSIASFLALKPLAKKLDLQLPNPTGIGANRLVGTTGSVRVAIPSSSSDSGLVKIGGEEWRAQGRDGMGIPAGTQVRVIEVKGTRVVVEPANSDGLVDLA